MIFPSGCYNYIVVFLFFLHSCRTCIRHFSLCCSRLFLSFFISLYLRISFSLFRFLCLSSRKVQSFLFSFFFPHSTDLYEFRTIHGSRTRTVMFFFLLSYVVHLTDFSSDTKTIILYPSRIHYSWRLIRYGHSLAWIKNENYIEICFFLATNHRRWFQMSTKIRTKNSIFFQPFQHASEPNEIAQICSETNTYRKFQMIIDPLDNHFLVPFFVSILCVDWLA